jgi:hypothetical protein
MVEALALSLTANVVLVSALWATHRALRNCKSFVLKGKMLPEGVLKVLEGYEDGDHV